MSRFPAGSKIHLTSRETHPHSGRRCWRRGERIRMADDAADAARDTSVSRTALLTLRAESDADFSSMDDASPLRKESARASIASSTATAIAKHLVEVSREGGRRVGGRSALLLPIPHVDQR